MGQQSMFKSYRVRDGTGADLLEALLKEAGIPLQDSVEDPEVEFIVSTRTKTHPDADVYMLATQKTYATARRAESAGEVIEVIRVDAAGEERAGVLRALTRILTRQSN